MFQWVGVLITPPADASHRLISGRFKVFEIGLVGVHPLRGTWYGEGSPLEASSRGPGLLSPRP